MLWSELHLFSGPTYVYLMPIYTLSHLVEYYNCEVWADCALEMTALTENIESIWNKTHIKLLHNT